MTGPFIRLAGAVALTATLCLFALLIGSPSSARAETCHSVGSAQFIDAMHICVDSVLPNQGGNSYGPRNLFDSGDGKSWCEGAQGSGIGQTITLIIDGGAPFRTLLVANGYDKSGRSYRNNNRIRMVRIDTDTGLTTTRELPDTPSLVPVHLPRAGTYKRINVTILSVYPGAEYDDTCLNFIGPDFEEMEAETHGAAQPEQTPAPAPTPQATQVTPARPQADETAIGPRMRLPDDYRGPEQVKWLSQVMLAQGVFQKLAIADPALAIRTFGSRHAQKKWQSLSKRLWPDMDAGTLWSMFMATSVSVSGNFSAKRPVSVFYHPWSDLLLVLEWNKAVLPKKGSIADVEIIPASFLRGGMDGLDALPQWTRDGEAEARAVATRTGQMARLIESRFPPQGIRPWFIQIQSDSRKQWREIIRPTAHLLAQLAAVNADRLRAGTDDVADSARALAIGITEMGKAGRFSRNAGSLPFDVSQSVTSLPPERFGQYEPVAWLTGKNRGVIMLASVGGPPGCLSIRFSISKNGLRTIAVDAADYQPAYLQLVSASEGGKQ